VSKRWSERLRWVALAVAVAVVVIFLVAQRQSVRVSYGQSPASSSQTIAADDAVGQSAATVPTIAEMTAMVQANPVVRLPGSIAHWDEQRVTAASAGLPTRILVAPPGLDTTEEGRVRAVNNATIRVIGTEVTGGIYQAAPDSFDDWRSQFATGDVTNLLITLIAGLKKQPNPADVDALTRREPTAAELRTVAAGLRADGKYVAPGATFTDVPSTVASAFPDGHALVVVLPQQPFGTPLPRYGPALARLFPATPIVVMYGYWIEYDGPHATDFADVAGTSFYAHFSDLLSQHTYPQQNVLNAYLSRVTDVRYAGLFDRPLPYRPFDPLRVALPALPWLFAACVLIFLGLSVRSFRRPARTRRLGTPARLAALTALAVDMSALTDKASDPALTRGITQLAAARTALDDDLPDRQVIKLLNGAEAELDEAARRLPYAGFRPADYLQGTLS
jgi:hypothetical protein